MRHEEEEITRKATAMVVAEDDLDDEEEEDDDDSVAEEEQDATNLNPPDSRDSSVHSSMQSSLGNEEEEDDDEGNTEDEDEDENENEDGRTLMTICNQAVEEDADIKEIDNDLELHQQLNAEYILKQFYGWNSIINTVCFGGIIYHGILLVWNRRIIYSYVWGNEDVASSLSSSSLRLVLEAVLALVGWTILYSGRTYYVNPFQTSTHPEQGRIVFGRLLLFVLLSNQLINLVLPQTQHNSHNTNTKRWMDLLTMFAFAIVSRVLWTPRFYR